jgi:hypothetical protein
LLCVGHVIAEVDEELSQAALGGCVVAKNGLEGGVAEGLGETLAERFAGAVVVAESGGGVGSVMGLERLGC